MKGSLYSLFTGRKCIPGAAHTDLTPNHAHGYAWMLNRRGCSCGKAICECDTPEARERRRLYLLRVAPTPPTTEQSLP